MRQEMQTRLERVMQADGVQGIVLVSRDGIPVVEVLKRPLNQEMFAAMSAMMMGAAETAVAELGEKAPHHLIIETEGTKILIRGATDDLLLVVLGAPDMDAAALKPHLETAVQEITKLAG
jgi:hypothetical protein